MVKGKERVKKVQQVNRACMSQVMIAACDTFRSGAVEQLKTHCNRLNIPLYERGYEKDPAKVAFEAAKQAERAKCDVLLVDTAGNANFTYVVWLQFEFPVNVPVCGVYEDLCSRVHLVWMGLH